MRNHPIGLLAAMLLLASSTPARAEGRWCVSLGVGTSVSELRGSAIDAAAFAQVHPLLGIGLETGMAFMQFKSAEVVSFPVEPGGGMSSRLASLTDGLTRNRGLYMGPALKVGQQVYAVVSGGLYEFSDNDGHWLTTRWGGSAGVGMTGSGRFSPRAELRYRWVPDRGPDAIALPFERLAGPQFTRDASAIVFTMGINIR